jgi:nucleoside-diphosphate-sugar epimerase
MYCQNLEKNIRQEGEESRLAELVAVTGANGFIGRELVNRLSSEGFATRALLRKMGQETPPGVEQYVIGDLNSDSDFGPALSEATIVVHLAARVHEMNEDHERVYPLYERLNTQATLNLALAAAKLKVRRFIFLSTAKVNGQRTHDKAFSENDEPCPCGPYAISKWRGEQGLRRISQESGLEVVILRSPLVYGPGVGGNFLKLMELVSRTRLLPLGDLDNKRSMVGLGNLTDMILRCITHQHAAGETFFVSDGQDLSVTELIRLIASGLAKRCILLPAPKRMLKILATLAGKQEVVQRLVDSFQVDIGKAKRLLNWEPSTTVRSELTRTVQWYRRHGRSA